jgi:Protein NO VEIN, C-terminal
MATWVNDVIQSLQNLGGVAKYADLYKEVGRLRPGPLPASYEAIIRRTVEQHSSDSDAFSGRDLFYSVHGKGKGVWGLRAAPLPAPPAGDDEADEINDFEEGVKSGAGFGDPETNRRVETAAIAFVTKWYGAKGWGVSSVEAKKCGYDLLCTKNGDEEHVEVKGVKGTQPAFIITANEVRQAQSDPQFYICVVTSALADSRKLHRLSGEEFVGRYDIAPLAFRASRKAG